MAVRAAHVRSAIAPVQHVLGLAIAVALYILLLRLGLRPWVAALGCLPVLVDGYQIMLEQFILAETLFQALIVAAFFALLWNERVSWLAGALDAVLVSLAALTRVVGLALIPIVIVYVVVRRRSATAVASTIVASVVPLLAYAGWYDSVHGQFELTGNTWITLYGRLAPIADCEKLELPPRESVLCDRLPVAKRPSPNYYVFHPASPATRLPATRRNDALRDFSKQVIVHQPETYLRLVGGEFLHYFAPVRTTGRWDDPVEAYRFGEHLPAPPFVALLPDYPLERLLSKTPLVFRHIPFPNKQPSAGIAGFLRWYQDVATSPGPLIALAALLGILGAFARRAPGRRSLRAESALLATSGLALLVTPVATVIFDYRFLVPALPLLSAGGVVGATSILRSRGHRAGGP